MFRDSLMRPRGRINLLLERYSSALVVTDSKNKTLGRKVTGLRRELITLD